MRRRIQYYITHVILALALLPVLQASAQTSVTFKPNGAIGEDVFISTSFGCTPTGFPQPAEFTNWEMCGDLSYAFWTINDLNCSTNTASKTLIRFTEMNTLPPTAVIRYAELRLWTPSSSGCIPQGNSYFPTSWAPSNDGLVSRVTSGWTETGVTWNTQPSITTVNQTPAPPTNLQWNDYMFIDVTSLTQDIWAAMQLNPADNNGYMLELQTPAVYRSTVFAGSENTTPGIRPELYIELECDANFTLCNTSRYPNTFDFSAIFTDPTATYEWNFGDGSPLGVGPSAQHTYNSTGTFRVCLTVTSRNGEQCRQCLEICVDQVLPPPPRYGDYDPVRNCDAHFRACNSTRYPNTYDFTPLYPEPGATYTWNFGDGNTASGPSVRHSYMTPGTYTVCMTKRRADGRRCTECITICVREVVEPPVDNNPDDPDAAAKPLNAPGILYNADGGLLIDRVYPNPASADLHVELAGQQDEDVRYVVYSLDGRVLLNGQHPRTNGARFSISINKLPAGIYMLEVENGQAQARYKFIKE